MDNRQKVCKLFKQKIDLSETDINDLEKGIYNWCIDYSIDHKIIKNWNNPIFQRLYLEKSRQILSNIDKDCYINNPKLFERLKEKEFLPHEIAYMKPENICPSRWKDTIEKHLKKFEYAYENKKVATTDQFRCGKCKKRECTFYLMQTRSSDEPETIFIRCVNCGHQWRQ
jgi:DNA-directed RNA polymerase subunit M/transcription elongation factor TFIIS